MSQAQPLSAEHFSPSVTLHHGRPATTSLEVAQFFGKQHFHVLRTIKDLQDNCPKNFTASNFGLSEYTDETGRTLPLFVLYRDGFMLLVMGYTGKKALAVKLAYIEAFNRLEAELAAQREAALPEASPHNITDDIISAADAPLTPDQQCTLQAIVKAKVEGIPAAQRSKGLYPQIWSRFNNHFRLGSYKQLPQRRMSEAVTYLTRMEVTPKALPAGKPQHLFDRLGLSPYEKVLMGPQVRAMLDNEEEVGPRTLECILLKAKYMTVLAEVARLGREIAADLERTSLAGQVARAVNPKHHFTDPFVDTLMEDGYRLARLGNDFHDLAFRALNNNICMAKMLGA